MTSKTIAKDSLVLRQEIIGARRLSNYCYATIVTIGATGFLLAGLSSYFKVNLLPFANPTELLFIPQGIAMSFYGIAGILLAVYLWLAILWDVGGGYNEFNKETNQLQILRKGYPGKNRRIELKANLDEIQAVRADIKEGLNPRRALYLRVKGRRDIPLSRVGEPLSLTELENQGATLARFLAAPLEGL